MSDYEQRSEEEVLEEQKADAVEDLEAPETEDAAGEFVDWGGEASLPDKE